MSKMRNQSEKPSVIEEELNTIFSAEFLDKTAKETGFIIRNRIIKALRYFMWEDWIKISFQRYFLTIKSWRFRYLRKLLFLICSSYELFLLYRRYYIPHTKQRRTPIFYLIEWLCCPESRGLRNWPVYLLILD